MIDDTTIDWTIDRARINTHLRTGERNCGNQSMCVFPPEKKKGVTKNLEAGVRGPAQVLLNAWRGRSSSTSTEVFIRTALWGTTLSEGYYEVSF
jgi:hypothetical protein